MSRSLLRPLPRPGATRTLLCLSFCGGGTASFRPWAEALPPDVELVLYCYPGREGRYTVPFAADWNALLTDALDAVRTVAAERPYLLLGHSMGAWVAFDLTCRLEAGAGTPPRTLIASGADSPVRWAEKRRETPTSADTDEELLTWMSTVGQLSDAVLAEPELRAMAVEVFRADLLASDGYRYREGVTVRTPLQVLYGAEDDLEDPAKGWRPLAAGEFRADVLPGGHFYTPEVWARLPEAVAALHPAAAGNRG
ncbi:thioesterase II family protein [Streptomyces sp. NEAU-Y11]|uniref:thioesterase II family protein n=1 Tax=Streptomyces cucumeris TaxID=2962890 RepID=UPI0020C90D3F|nr:alpha/beta fold hydrolase [Streptomyces sp. NEAU-Y11]MCP9206887.1 alpha/beta fold hydrolase [Streptomyces sp. NEAU-Y11]